MDKENSINRIDEVAENVLSAQAVVNDSSVEICTTNIKVPNEHQINEKDLQIEGNKGNLSNTPKDIPGQSEDNFTNEQNQSIQTELHGISATHDATLPSHQLESSEPILQGDETGGKHCDISRNDSRCNEENILNEQEPETKSILDETELSATNGDEAANQQFQLSNPYLQRDGNELTGEQYVSVIDPERNIDTLPILKSELNFTKDDMNEICREIFKGCPETREEYSAESPPTTTKKSLKRKMKRKSETPTTLHCATCSYSTKHRTALINHMVSHRKPSETTMYKCEYCGHETKRKPDLKAHMIIHRDPSELRLFYCANCPYKTKRKCDLKQHMSTHQDKSTYKCPHCSYQTNNQLYLEKIHLLTHKDELEVNLYKCDKCIYQTKIKQYLNHHLRTAHKDPETLELFYCNWCDFKTKNKVYIGQHVMLIHTCPSEIQMFKCDMCNFETKRKRGLRDHKINKHIDTEQEYRCAHCAYKTKQRGCIRIHVKLHMDPWKVQMYNCDKCGFTTRRRRSLIAHKKRLKGCIKT